MGGGNKREYGKAHNFKITGNRGNGKLDFFKVLRSSFPVPVVGKTKNSSPRFALEKHFELDLWVSLIGS